MSSFILGHNPWSWIVVESLGSMLLSWVPFRGILPIPLSSFPSYPTRKSSMRTESEGSMEFLVFCMDYLAVFMSQRLVENDFSWIFLTVVYFLLFYILLAYCFLIMLNVCNTVFLKTFPNVIF